MDTAKHTYTDGFCDRFAGMIFGHALGDAVGFLTELEGSPPIYEKSFPYNTPREPFTDPSTWTDETAMSLILMSSLIDQGKIASLDIASRLHEWAKSHQSGKCLRSNAKFIITNMDYTERPYAYSDRTVLSNNEGIHLAMPLAGTSVDNEQICDVVNLITSAPICSVVNCAIIHTLRHIMDGASRISPLQILTENIIASLDEDDPLMAGLAGAIRTGNESPISACKLETDQANIINTLKVFAYTLQAMQFADINNCRISYKKVILKIANEHGDSDSNCAVAGALLGASLGYSGLPADWLAGLNGGEKLHDILEAFLSICDDL